MMIPTALARRLDFWLNYLLYAGPILAGATMLDHFQSFEVLGKVGLPFFTTVPAFMSATHRAWTLGVVMPRGPVPSTPGDSTAGVKPSSS
jgi:hypothetical protein